MMKRFLDGIERVGNLVPHPSIIFLILIAILAVLSLIFALTGASATMEVVSPDETLTYQTVAPETVHNYEEVADPSLVNYTADQKAPPLEITEETVHVRSLISTDGIRFIFTSFVRNFQNFGVVSVIIVAMLGVGLSEEAGMIAALIKRMVQVAPPGAITFIIVLLGVVSSIATDAGYLVLIPLAAAVFLTLGRHPIAGLAAGFAGVGAAFGVNVLVTPSDAMLTEITNEALTTVAPGRVIDITHNLYFGIVSTFLLAVVGTVITNRLIEPRLGAYTGPAKPESSGGVTKEEARGLRAAGFGLLGFVLVMLVLTVPSWAPLRNPETGALMGNSPFMDSIVFLIFLLFFVTGLCYGKAAGTIKSSNDAINAMVKTVAGLSGLIFLMVIISQFIAYLNYTQLATVGAIKLGDALQASGFGPIPLLVGFVIVTLVVDIFIGGVVPKWAIFAPIFVPLFLRLGISPEAATAAYRVGDSPMNVATPLMAYFALIISFGERYEKKFGVGSLISLMLPYTAVFAVVWTVLLVVWYLVGIPLGPNAPVR